MRDELEVGMMVSLPIIRHKYGITKKALLMRFTVCKRCIYHEGEKIKVYLLIADRDKT